MSNSFETATTIEVPENDQRIVLMPAAYAIVSTLLATRRWQGSREAEVTVGAAGSPPWEDVDILVSQEVDIRQTNDTHAEYGARIFAVEFYTIAVAGYGDDVNAYRLHENLTLDEVLITLEEQGWLRPADYIIHNL